MKTAKFLIITLLCVGLASVADAKNKGRHRAKKGKKHHPTASATPAVPVPPAPAGHHTITPFVISNNSPGTWTYGANLSSGAVNAGDGFTIFDFGGLVPGSVTAPAGWTITVGPGSVLSVPAIGTHPDNPAIDNLLFIWSGATIGPTLGLQFLGNFTADTTSTGVTMVSWSSRDHDPAGAVGAPHNDVIAAPAGGRTTVPEGGATVALLGIGLTSLEALRRMIRARKA